MIYNMPRYYFGCLYIYLIIYLITIAAYKLKALNFIYLYFMILYQILIERN